MAWVFHRQLATYNYVSLECVRKRDVVTVFYCI